MRTFWQKWQPTDKWYATFFTGAAAVIGSWVETGWDTAERSMVAALIPALVAAYWITDRNVKPEADALVRKVNR
jgi:hypothetical protein